MATRIELHKGDEPEPDRVLRFRMEADDYDRVLNVTATNASGDDFLVVSFRVAPSGVRLRRHGLPDNVGFDTDDDHYIEMDDG